MIAVAIPSNIALMTYICREWVGVSPAVIQSFTSMTAFTTAILFYIIYDEKLAKQHLIGMCMIVVSVMIVAICKTISIENGEVASIRSRWIIMLPIAIVFVNCILLTICSYMARVAKTLGYSAL